MRLVTVRSALKSGEARLRDPSYCRSHFLQLKYFLHSLVMLSAPMNLPNLCVSVLQPSLLYITNQVIMSLLAEADTPEARKARKEYEEAYPEFLKAQLAASIEAYDQEYGSN